MKRKLLTLMLGIMFIFVLAGSSIAETKISSANSARALNSRNVTTINMVIENTLIAKYKKLKQICAVSVGWTCSSALDHADSTIAMTRNVCNGSGWGSDICGEYIDWETRTADWAFSICDSQSASVRRKPQKVIANNSMNREIFG